MDNDTDLGEREGPPVPTHRAETSGMNGRNRTPSEVIEDLEFNTWNMSGEPRRQALEIIGWLKELKEARFRMAQPDADRDRMDAQAQGGEFVDVDSDKPPVSGARFSPAPGVVCEEVVHDMTPEEAATRLYLEAMVAAGYILRCSGMSPDDANLTVDGAISRAKAHGHKPDGMLIVASADWPHKAASYITFSTEVL